MTKQSFLVFLLLSLSASGLAPADSSTPGATFPRLMGMNIGAKNYDDARYQQDLARLDVVILGFYKGWRPQDYAPTSTAAMRKVVQEIKTRHPGILVGQYTILNEVYGEPSDVSTADLRAK